MCILYRVRSGRTCGHCERARRHAGIPIACHRRHGSPINAVCCCCRGHALRARHCPSPQGAKQLVVASLDVGPRPRREARGPSQPSYLRQGGRCSAMRSPDPCPSNPRPTQRLSSRCSLRLSWLQVLRLLTMFHVSTLFRCLRWRPLLFSARLSSQTPFLQPVVFTTGR